jgi:hypothetical protein
MKKPQNRAQIAKFKTAARELGAEKSERQFSKTLKKIAVARAPKKKARKNRASAT